mmetsp:Transcript_4596/g.12998  ORF Transcript_4596/g.12998 Transcript_4596/m.12998 type:complete len:265 (-) Transcript_4596:304-1098(-)
MTTCELRASPTFLVILYSHSLLNMDRPAMTKAGAVGMFWMRALNAAPPDRWAATISISFCPLAAPTPTPVASKVMARKSDPMASNLPWPYGWSSSGGNRPIWTAHKVIKSENRSDSECPASATNADEWHVTPTAAFPTDKSRLITTPSNVTRSALLSFLLKISRGSTRGVLCFAIPSRRAWILDTTRITSRRTASTRVRTVEVTANTPTSERDRRRFRTRAGPRMAIAAKAIRAVRRVIRRRNLPVRVVGGGGGWGTTLPLLSA